MKSETAINLRKTGISVAGDVPWGTHLCHFYETKQDLLDTLVPYFKAGLESKEFCLWVLSDADLITVEEAKEALAEAVPDLERHLRDENIEIINGQDWYFEQHALNLERAKDGWDAKLKRALARGYQGLRASADTFWLAQKDWKDFFAYEKQVNDWIINQSMTVMCTYPLAKSGASEVLDVVQAHQFAIARRRGEWEVIETPQLVQAKDEIKRLNEKLEERVIERTNELRATNEELRKKMTERKQAEDDLRQQKEILQQIFDHIPVMINFVGADGSIKLVNRDWERTLGWPLEEIRQQNIDIFAECYPDLEYRQQVLKFVAKAKGEWSDFKTRVRNGRVLDTSWVRVHLSDGTSIGIGKDITESKRAQDSLRRSEDKLRLVIDTIPTMAWSLRPDGVLDFVNQRWLDYTGLSFEDAIEEPTRTVHPEDLPRALEKWLAVKDTSEPYEDEMRMQRADGEYRWFLIRIAPLLDEQGNLLERYGVAIDIEQRKQAEKALAERLRFETLVTELSAAFANLSSNEVDREINKWLQTLVEFLGVDRATFLQFGEDWTTFYRSHSYTVPGIEPLPPTPMELKNQFPWITDQLRRGVTVKLSRIPDDLPEVAAKEREYAAKFGVKSGLNIPVLVGGSVICAITFSSIVTYRDWPDEMVARLRLVGEIFASVVERKHAQALLHAKEQEFRAIVENAPDQIIRYDRGFRRTYVNPAVAKAYGLPAEALLGKPTGSVIKDAGLDVKEDELAEVQQRIAAVFDTGKSYKYEMTWPMPTGRKHFSVRLFPEVDFNGSVINVLGIARDITERRIAEEELKKEKETLEKIFDNIPVMIGFVDNDGGVKLVNPEWERTIGWTLKELQEQNVDIFAEAYPNESYRREVLDFVAAATGEWVDLKIKVRDGRVIDAACAVVHLSDGTRVAIASDITGRKRAENALRRSEDRIRLIIDTIHTMAWTVRPDGNADFVNQRWLDYTGLTWEQYIQAPNALIHPEDRTRVVDKWLADMAAGEPYETEMRLRRADGEYRWFLVRTEPLRDEQGNLLKWYGVSTDIEDLKLAEEALKESQRRLQEAQRIAHVGHWERDLATGIVTWSDELHRILGVPLEARDSQLPEWLEVVYPEDRPGMCVAIEELERGIRRFDLEFRIVRPSGEVRFLHSQGDVIRDEQGRPLRRFGTAQDITERKLAEDALREALVEINKLKDQLYKENIALREEIVNASMFEEIIGNSPALHEVLVLVAKVAPTDSTVLITGETGTGKELIARAIHKRSNRASHVFMSVNCAAIPPGLIASELFGHEKGAFTGAVQQRLGRFELAEGGTIFLDEIGELPAETQIALLRVLQEHEFTRVGGTKTISADVRVIAATNRDLRAAIEAGSFRRDLFYRLNVFPIEMPSLRDRREDIPLLVEYFIQRYASKMGKKMRRIDRTTLEMLASSDWPGNIRELQNVIERSVILNETEILTIDKSWLSHKPQRTFQEKALLDNLATHQKEIIEAALAESRGRVSGPTGAAAKLGIPPSTLDSKIRALKINKHRFKTP